MHVTGDYEIHRLKQNYNCYKEKLNVVNYISLKITGRKKMIKVQLCLKFDVEKSQDWDRFEIYNGFFHDFVLDHCPI